MIPLVPTLTGEEDKDPDGSCRIRCRHIRQGIMSQASLGGRFDRRGLIKFNVEEAYKRHR